MIFHLVLLRKITATDWVSLIINKTIGETTNQKEKDPLDASMKNPIFLAIYLCAMSFMESIPESIRMLEAQLVIIFCLKC